MTRRRGTWIAFALWSIALVVASGQLTRQSIKAWRIGQETVVRESAADPSRELHEQVEAAPAETPDIAGFGTRRFVMGVAVRWMILLMAIVAVGLLLHVALDLADRRGAFVAAVSHELRTPLTTLIMYSEMLEDGTIDDEESRREFAATLRAEAEHLERLIDNVLVHARLEGERPAAMPEPVWLSRMIEAVGPRMERRCVRAGMRLSVETEPDAGELIVQADPIAIERILVNLVDNAAKYAAGTENPQVHIEIGREAGCARLAVRDHGPGIAPGRVRRLFKPFCQGPDETDTRRGGIGLGLALSRRLARTMGGDLRLDPAPPTGARFILMLPLAAGCAESAIQPTTNSAAASISNKGDAWEHT